jgi:hypothetical protein
MLSIFQTLMINYAPVQSFRSHSPAHPHSWQVSSFTGTSRLRWYTLRAQTCIMLLVFFPNTAPGITSNSAILYCRDPRNRHTPRLPLLRCHSSDYPPQLLPRPRRGTWCLPPAEEGLLRGSPLTNCGLKFFGFITTYCNDYWQLHPWYVSFNMTVCNRV